MHFETFKVIKMEILDNLEHFHLKSANPLRYTRRRQGREAKNANKKKHLELIYGMFVLIFFATKDPASLLSSHKLWNHQ